MKIENQLKNPTDKGLRNIFLITFSLSLIFMVIFNFVLMPVFPQGAGLMDIKNAWNKEKMEKIIAIWNADPSKDYRNQMIFIDSIDFVFMICYGLALYSALLIVARKLESKKSMQKFYLYGSNIFPIFAVGFDILENVNELIMLADPGNIQDINAFGASASAFLCMIFLYSGLLFALLGLIISKSQSK